VKGEGSMTTTLQDAIREALNGVKDPEIDSVSILDLGMVETMDAEATEHGYLVRVTLLPTFLG